MKHRILNLSVAALAVAALLLAAVPGRSEVLCLQRPGKVSVDHEDIVFEMTEDGVTSDQPAPALAVLDRMKQERLAVFREMKAGQEFQVRFWKARVLSASLSEISLDVTAADQEVHIGFGTFFNLTRDDVISIPGSLNLRVVNINYVPLDGKHSVDVDVDRGGRLFPLTLKPELKVNLGVGQFSLENVVSFNQFSLVVEPPVPISAATKNSTAPAASEPAISQRIQVLARPETGGNPLDTMISFKIRRGDDRARFISKLVEKAGVLVKGLDTVIGQEKVNITIDSASVAEALSVVLRSRWFFTYNEVTETVIIGIK